MRFGAIDAQQELTPSLFTVRVHLFESTNPPSPYRADIEEYWVSPQEWRRSIDTPEFKQTLIANGDQVSEQDTGDYYPLVAEGLHNRHL
jgi:hypothetical protein